MATKSILKEVRFKDKKLCRGFAGALEFAKGKKIKKLSSQEPVKRFQKTRLTTFSEINNGRIFDTVFKRYH